MRLVRRKSRRPEALEKLQLEKVIGLTSSNGNGLAANPATGDIAFLAGCIVVVVSTDTYRQTRFFMVSRTPKALACVAYSPHGGKLIAAGECGHQPAVVVWDASDGSCLAQLKAHKYGISCIKFSPNGKHILSAGFPHDGQVCLFDFKSGTLLSKAKAATASSPVSEMVFAADGSFFITAGSNQLKHWSVLFHTSRQQRSTSATVGSHTLDARNINTGSLSESSFVALAFSEDFKDNGGMSGIAYALASAGILCLLHRGLAVKKWVNLKVQNGYSLCVLGSHIACACSNGIVRIFMSETLTYMATLPHPAPLGFHDLMDANTCGYLAKHNVNGITYPDAIACCFATPVVLVVLYADHSLFIWDTTSLSNIQKRQSFLYHSQCIWDVINLPSQMNQASDTPYACKTAKGLDGQDIFATCSSDGSVRLWHIESADAGSSKPTQVNESHCNVYDKSLSGVLYQDKRGEPEFKSTTKKIDAIDSSGGFRSISASPDGQFLAAGDRSGNLHIYDLNSLQIAYFKEAHDAEILTLSFGSVAVEAADNKRKEVTLLASGGRDRLVHMYNASRDFEVLETLDDHSASVTALKFAYDGSKLLSSSADKSVVFRNIECDCLDIKSTRYHQEMASRGTVYDLDIDTSKKLAVTVGQDKKLNFLSLSTGKFVKSFKPEGDSGEPIKVKVDPSGTCLVCSHSDKSLRIYDISNGELLSSGQGHSEVITGVIFMPDCKRLISVSGDSCIFVWKLPSLVSKMMRKRCNFHSESQSGNASTCTLALSEKQEAMSSTATLVHTSYHRDTVPDEAIVGTPHAGSGLSSAFKFSVSRLPHWAQAKVSQTIVAQDENTPEGCSLHSSDSRWAERLGAEGYKLFCEPEVSVPPVTVLPNNCAIRRRFTIEPSASSAYSTPESSLESQLSGTSSFSPSFSPCVSGRKHSQWKTVHTLFFDEEYSEDDGFSGKGQENDNRSGAITVAREETENFGNDNSFDDEQHPTMSIISMLSQNNCGDESNSDREPFRSCFQMPVKLACTVTNGSERAEFNSSRFNSCSTQSGRFDFREGIQSYPNFSRKDILERQRHRDQLIVPIVDETSDEDESDLPLSPDRDLFNSHFGNLSTAIKVPAGQASARSSFSARFFAQSSHFLPVLSLFQDSPHSEATRDMKGKSIATGAGISTCSLLSKEREILKHKESQEQVLDGAATMVINSCSQTLIMNDDGTKEVETVGKTQLVPSTVSEQGPTTLSDMSIVDTSIIDSQADQCCLDLPTLECAILINDSKDQGSSCLPSASIVDSQADNDQCCSSFSPLECANVASECNVKSHTSAPCSNQIGVHNRDMMADQSIASGEEKLVGHEGQNCSMQWIDEGNCTDVATNGPGSIAVDLLNRKETVNGLKKALQDMSHAVDKALAAVKELDSIEGNEAMVTTLAGLYDEFIPPTLQKVWLLSDSMASLHQTSQTMTSASHLQPSLEFRRSSYSDHGILRLSNTGENASRPCTTVSVASSSALESIDIEGFIQNYSVRFSATLASQVLALVQKGLSCNQNKE